MTRLAAGALVVAVALVLAVPTVGAAETTPPASAAKKKPKLKDACKLLSTTKLSAIIGKGVQGRQRRGPHPTGRSKFGCFWRTGTTDNNLPLGLDLLVLPMKSAKAAKAEYKFRHTGPFSPPPNNVKGIGDAAFTFGTLITVRSGRYVLEAGFNDPDVIGPPGSDVKGNAAARKIAKPAVRKLRKSYR